jgi:poly(3-hydroxybutyrate) depolymerase
VHTRATGARIAIALTAVAALAGAAAPAGAQAPAAAVCPRAAAATPAGPPPLHLFAYDRAAPLDLRDSVARVDGPVAVHRVSFASPRGGRVTGLLHVPADSLRGPGGRFAGLVLLHGAPGDAAGMEGAAGPLARAGAVVLTIDAPFARRDPRQPITFTARDSAETVQYVVDLRRAVDVLLARADVDPARLGALGISYGGASGALFAGVERRVAAYALAVATAAWPSTSATRRACRTRRPTA